MLKNNRSAIIKDIVTGLTEGKYHVNHLKRFISRNRNGSISLEATAQMIKTQREVIRRHGREPNKAKFSSRRGEGDGARMRKERKTVAESERATLEKIRNAERFQNEARQKDRLLHTQLTGMRKALELRDSQVSERDRQIEELKKQLQRALDHLDPQDHVPNNNDGNRTPENDDDNGQGVVP
jgi:hypothetical protein